MNKALLISLIMTALLIGIGIGYYFTPSYKEEVSMRASGMVPLGNPDAFIDHRYLKNLVAHHQTAIDISRQALNESQREEIKTLSQAIIDGDTKSIDKLNQWRQEWYQDSRPVIRYQKINIGSADSNVDLRFLNAMIAHHEEAIDMATEIMGKSTRNDILTEASAVKQFLTENILTLKTWRKTWYGI